MRADVGVAELTVGNARCRTVQQFPVGQQQFVDAAIRRHSPPPEGSAQPQEIFAASTPRKQIAVVSMRG